MFRNTPLAGTPTFKLILGFGLCTLGGAMLYVYYKNQRDDEENEKTDTGGNNIAAQQLCKGKTSQKQHKQEAQVTINLDVANEHIPLLAGRSGSNLSLIEESTGTKIKFRDKNKSHKQCDISGTTTAVKKARSLLLKELERAPIVEEELLVPQTACGKIMGRCGEAIQEICRLSLAKVSVEAAAGSRPHDQRRINIVGNRQQVNIARKLIEEKIDEDAALRQAVDDAVQKREPRRSPSNSVNSSLYSSQTSLSSHVPPRDKLLGANEKPLEVYVSAIASPSKFWLQIIGKQTKRLDDMVAAMTEYYAQLSNRELHNISEPYLGQIVAAIFKYDGKWYRAEIVGIMPNQYNASEVVLDLYFVDYGDSEYVSPHEVFELRTDFLTLRFQAVECFLANIKPTLPAVDAACPWESQSVQKFEELTQVANWKKLSARVITYKERPKSLNGASMQRETSPIPGVELYDLNTEDGMALSIGQALILHGYALSASDEHVRPRSPYYYTSPPTSPPLSMTSSMEVKPAIGGTLAPVNNHTQLTEDAHMREQLQHIHPHPQGQQQQNIYLNGNTDVRLSDSTTTTLPGKCNTTRDFLNNDTAVVSPPASNRQAHHNLNGNSSR